MRAAGVPCKVRGAGNGWCGVLSGCGRWMARGIPIETYMYLPSGTVQGYGCTHGSMAEWQHGKRASKWGDVCVVDLKIEEMQGVGPGILLDDDGRLCTGLESAD